MNFLKMLISCVVLLGLNTVAIADHRTELETERKHRIDREMREYQNKTTAEDNIFNVHEKMMETKPDEDVINLKKRDEALGYTTSSE